jgi:hypothetical protein
VDFRNGAIPAELVLDSVTVIGNGDGGIQLSNTNFPVTAQDQVKLTLLGESFIYYNSGGQGGGINCLNATVLADGGSEVSANFASDHGGGIYADGCHVRFQGSRLVGNVSATRGGGLYLTGSNAGANFNAEETGVASAVVNNRAQRGGGIAVAGDARADLVDAVVSDNVALVEGGAFWLAPGAAMGNGTRLLMRGASVGDVSCLRAEDCNTVANNQAWDSQLAPGARAKPGSLIAFGASPEGKAHALFVGTRIERNRGTTLSQQANRSELTFNGALIVDNHVEAQMFDALITGGGLRVTASTIAGNHFPLPGVPVFLAPTTCGSGVTGLRVERSIVWQPTEQAFPGTLGPLDPACYRYLIASNFPGLPASPERISDDPQFRDPATGDYRLAPASPGVDFAPPVTAPVDWTRDGTARSTDRPAITDRFGIQDLGAYEQNDEHVVMASVAGGLGAVAQELQSVVHGTRAIVVATPAPGWRAVWPAGGTCAAGNAPDETTWRTGIVTSDCRVDVFFKYQASFESFVSSPGPSTWGEPVILSATLDAYQPGVHVVFYDGADVLDAAPVDAAGVARLSVTTLAPGSHTLTATWSGDQNNRAALPISVTHTVNRAATTTTLTPLTVRYGEPVVVSVAVSSPSPDAGSPTGAIQVSSPASAQLCTIVLPATSCTLATAGRHGTFELRAQYSGDTHFLSSSDQETLIITPQYVGGSIVGLDAGGLTLGLEVEGSLRRTRGIVSGSSAFVFDDFPVPVGASYAIVVTSQPDGRTCRVDQGSGSMPPADITNVSVICTVNTYSMTLDVGDGGSVVASNPPGLDASRVPHGTVVTLVATPQAGFRLSELTGCGGAPVDVSPYTTDPVTAPCTVRAVFVQSGATPAHVAVSITNGRSVSVPGDVVSYEIIAYNHSGVAVNGLSLTSTLPIALGGATWTCDAASAAFCTPASGSGNLAMGLNLPPSSSARVLLGGTLGAFQGSVSVTADLTVPPAYEDITYADNSATDTDQLNTTLCSAAASRIRNRRSAPAQGN